ncbi:MAG: hypothetical protein KAJ44_01270 [Thermoplasmatales archaeon]|nr:hypothetical protein [Thermoplasmatales archaeon]
MEIADIGKVENMTDKKKGKAEEVAEDTGELVGKGVKKGWGVVKSFIKGTKETITDKKKKK